MRKQHPMNARRAAKAFKALKAAGYECQPKDGLKDGIADLLTDLHHLCDDKGFSFRDRLKSADGNYQAEAVEPDDIEQDCRRLEGLPG